MENDRLHDGACRGPSRPFEDALDSIADRIVAELGPKTVLNIGCWSRVLTDAFRGWGVEAVGLEFPQQAHVETGSGARPHRRIASVKDPFDDRYDLITWIGGLEGLGNEEEQAIARICRSTEHVLFAARADGLEEATQVAGRTLSFWVERFAEHGFRLDVDFDAGFIGPYAMRFRKGKTDGSLTDALLAQRAALQRRLAAVSRSAGEKDKLIADLSFRLFAIHGSTGWKALERLRGIRDRVLPANSRRHAVYWVVRRCVEVLRNEGLRACFRKARYRVRDAWSGQGLLPRGPGQDLNRQYQVWLERHRITSHAVEEMKAAVEGLRYTPRISILTPVYNVDEAWLRKAIESVRAQIYSHWELCLVNDAATEPHVSPTLDEYAAADPRIRVKHLARNEGIVGASTHALHLATGEFVGFLDHDDELSPDALFEVVKRLNEDPDLDLIYSDEDKLTPAGRRVEPFFKPDWSPDLLLSVNYINHFSVFRRNVLTEAGGFRHGFDGSQDHDALLRVTERTDRIAHIPKVLYHWRKTPGSAAATVAAKPFAHEAARRAIEDALSRRGYGGQVESVLPGLYTVRYRLYSTPLVSIIVPTRDRWQLLQQCLCSIEEKTGYARYEIIVLDNDSAEPETLRYLDGVAGKWRVCRYPGRFNFSAINNFGATKASGDYLVFLNNDVQVIRTDWLAALLEQAQRPEVGAVGAKLLYPDGRIQHAGVVLGVGGVAGHAFKYSSDNVQTYFGFSHRVRNCSAVTAACMMVSRRAFEEVGGFNARLRVAFNDVDFCLRLRQRGYLIVYTPLALLYHHESATRGRLHPPEDEELFLSLWGETTERGDPYYNPNLTLFREDWSLRV